MSAGAPEGASAEEISAMVRQAVEASSQPGASKEDIEELVTNAVSGAAPAQSGVSADEVQKIVSEAVKAIPEKIVVQEVVLQPIAAPAESLEEGKVGIFNRPPEADPKRGGIVRTGWPIAVQHFDLHQGAIAYGGMTMMYNNLVYWNAADGERTIIPDLAESWDISPTASHGHSLCGRECSGMTAWTSLRQMSRRLSTASSIRPKVWLQGR